jgi:hypothetical protein
MAGSVTKRIGCRLYGLTVAMGSTRRFHAKQMHLRISRISGETSQFLPKLSACTFDSHNFQTGHLDEHTVDHNQQTSKQKIPAQDEINPVQSR